MIKCNEFIKNICAIMLIALLLVGFGTGANIASVSAAAVEDENVSYWIELQFEKKKTYYVQYGSLSDIFGGGNYKPTANASYILNLPLKLTLESKEKGIYFIYYLDYQGEHNDFMEYFKIKLPTHSVPLSLKFYESIRKYGLDCVKIGFYDIEEKYDKAYYPFYTSTFLSMGFWGENISVSYELSTLKIDEMPDNAPNIIDSGEYVNEDYKESFWSWLSKELNNVFDFSFSANDIQKFFWIAIAIVIVLWVIKFIRG